MEKKRIQWIDITKGIAILMVLYGHSMRDEMRLVSPVLDYTYRCCYIFHMAYFFWLSGYSYQLGRKNTQNHKVLPFVSKKVKRQILPWAGYTILIYFIFNLAMQVSAVSTVLKNAGYFRISVFEYAVNAIQANNEWAYHLWFIYVLFIISVLIFGIDCICNKNRDRAKVIVLSACLIGLILIRLVNVGSWWRLLNYLFLYIPFYVLGIFMQGKEDKIKCVNIWGGIGLLYILARAWLWSGFSGNQVDTSNIWSDMLVWYGAILLLPGVFLLMRKLGIYLEQKENKVIQGIKYLGKNSFSIYLFHQPFCCAFVGVILYNKMKLPAVLVMMICIVLSIVLPYILVKVMERAKVWIQHRRKFYT